MQLNPTDQISDINVLKGEVIDQIAAGEVIERPAQLLKEIVENSLDAGANEIEISVTSDLSFLSVQDNGSGIKSVDLPKVFLRHSTSKLKKTEDLFQLSSFGFRGEALSAIGSVSKAQIETRHLNEESGHIYIYENGEEILFEETQREPGTKITITNLFDSTPARKKFLKSKRHELTLVKRVLNSFSLNHNQVSFKFLLDGKLNFYFTKTETLEQRYEQVFKEQKVFKVELPECEIIKKGSHIYLEEPSIESKTGQGLWIFVQDRYIQDKTIAAAVREGLNTYLMHGTFPRGLVDLKLKKDFVDVNVHPMKSEVRFENSSYIYKAIRKAVSEWAYKAPWKKEIINSIEIKKNFFERETDDKRPRVFSNSQVPVKEDMNSKNQIPLNLLALHENRTQYKKTYGDLKSNQVKTILKKEDSFEPYWSSLMVIGQVNLTYLVAQSEEAVFFIDQHAAHERVAFERLKKQWEKAENRECQSLLMPIHLDLSEVHVESILELSEDLVKIGIEIEASGPESIALNAIPSFLNESSIVKGLKQLAEDKINVGGGASIDEIFELFFATLACHSVIRSGHAMSDDEIRLLLLDMDRYKSRYCPHGRPVYKKISFDSLDRDFGRKV
jgi:DNA mismatch repair protein MutL